MKPYYQDDSVTIYNCDNMQFDTSLLPEVDLLLTDPPYGIGDKMQGGTWGAAQKYSDFRSWDKAPDLWHLWQFVEIAKWSIVWGGNYFSLSPSRCWLVWDKKNAVPTMADCELAWSNIDKPAKRFSCGVGVHAHGHPTEKPLPLFKWCISHAPKAEVIFDPYVGSGTTLRAAKDLGCKAVGVEINERYCEIAAKRMAQEVLAL